MGIATNSKGNIYIYHRANETRLFEYTPAGHVHPRDRPQQLRLRLRALGARRRPGQHLGGRRRHRHARQVQPRGQGADDDRPARPIRWHRSRNMPGQGAFHGRNEKYRFGRETDVAFDQQGNIFVSDGYSDARVVKFDKNGRFVKAVGTRGQRQPAVQHAALDRHRLPGQRLRRRSRQRARAGARQRPELEGELHRTSATRGRCACRAARARRTPASSISTSSNSWPDSAPAAQRRVHRRGLQDGARRHDRRQVRHGPARRRASSRRSTRWTAAIPNVIYTAEINDWRSQKILLKPQATTDDERRTRRRPMMTRDTQGSSSRPRRSWRSAPRSRRSRRARRSRSTPTPTC